LSFGTFVINNNEKIREIQAEAEAALNRFIEKARKTESDPCDIKSEIIETENGANLTARFTFSCQAEAMIFELANR